MTETTTPMKPYPSRADRADAFREKVEAALRKPPTQEQIDKARVDEQRRIASGDKDADDWIGYDRIGKHSGGDRPSPWMRRALKALAPKIDRHVPKVWVIAGEDLKEDIGRAVEETIAIDRIQRAARDGSGVDPLRAAWNAGYWIGRRDVWNTITAILEKIAGASGIALAGALLYALFGGLS